MLVNNDFIPQFEHDYTSLLYWFPKIQSIQGLNIPETHVLRFPEKCVFSEERFAYLKKKEVRKQIGEICNVLGFPLFIRTDYYSGKHNWKRCCFVSKKEDLYSNIWSLFEESDCACIVGLPVLALVFRKYIPLFSNFTFFRGDFPVSKERRFFINHNKIQCKHPYWFLDVFERDLEMRYNSHLTSSIVNLFDNDIKSKSLKFIDEKNAKLKEITEKLSILNSDSEEDTSLLNEMISKVATIFSEYWSVDFAYGIDGKWYLIDMAKGEVSYHYFDCKFAKCDDKK